MTYRDDREALQRRVQALEEDLGHARREGEEEGREAAKERAEELEKKLASVRGELDRMGEELRELRGGEPAAKARDVTSTVVLLAKVGLVAITAGGLYLYLHCSAREPPRPGPAPVMLVEAPKDEPARAPEPPAVPERPAKQAEPVMITRTSTARWKATVKRAEGVALAPGASCVVQAAMRTSNTNATVPAITVTCGKLVLYDNRATLNGTSHMDNDAREQLGPSDDKSTFTLQYSDVGARTGPRAQIDLDTKLRQGAVFRETLPRFRVELSVPVESEPTAPLAGAAQRLRRSARVTEVSGAAGVKVGAACVLRAMATGKGEECVAEVRCGATVLFAASTEGVRCSYSAGQVTRATRNGAPIELEMSESTAQVKGSGAKGFAAALAFEAAPGP